MTADPESRDAFPGTTIPDPQWLQRPVCPAQLSGILKSFLHSGHVILIITVPLNFYLEEMHGYYRPIVVCTSYYSLSLSKSRIYRDWLIVHFVYELIDRLSGDSEKASCFALIPTGN